MAGFNINAFQTNISQSGYLQNNKFIVAFNSPSCMQNETINGVPSLDVEKLVQVRADSVKIPGIALLQSDIHRHGVGPSQKMPFSTRFTENSISFISDRYGQIYKYFYTWMNKIHDFSGTAADTNAGASYSTEYKDNYVTDLYVYVYDNSGNEVKQIVMYKAYPESINDINLSWNETNQLLKITVSISYRDWAMVGVSNARNGTELPERTDRTTTFAGQPPGLTPTMRANNTQVKQS